MFSLLKEGASVGDFSTRSSANLLTHLNIGDEFLFVSPEDWNDSQDYQEGKRRVENIRVVNDTAERGVKLVEDFNKSLTNDEEEKQFLLAYRSLNQIEKLFPLQLQRSLSSLL